MEQIEHGFKTAVRFVLTFLTWIIIAAVTGAVGGVVGSLFHKSVEQVTVLREKHDFLIFLLPLGGLVIAGLYKLCKRSDDTGTNQIFNSVREDGKVSFWVAPLIFISTVITHLFGGSAGREGAALQLGGTIGSKIGGLFRLDKKDQSMVVMCGMSGVFSALFGTPLTATFFAIEVISVGSLYYAAIIPCLASALTAYWISRLFGIEPVKFALSDIPVLSWPNIGRVIVLGVGCAVVSIIFCFTIHKTEHYMKKLFKNTFIRAFVGGLVVVGLTLLVGNRDYNGSGMNIISDAISGKCVPYAFLLKIIFTAVTIGAGYKGGEIVPTFFAGSTLGCFLGNAVGLPAGFGAAVGLTALFCGVVNSPISSIILSIELFGSQGLLLFAIACGVSYMLSGYYGLYSSQKIVYSKLRLELHNEANT
ncbi:MAG: chloride channel protein [Clostridiales bacterium]|nr:chloride channel protein [Clostridiales bacterium]